MPQPVNYICTKCEFRGSSFSTWGKYSYLINNEQISINRTIAICYSCQSIVSVEILPNQERVEKLNSSSDYLQQKFYEEELQRLEALSQRKSSARCLECGSHDFEIIPNVEPDKKQRKTGIPIRTGLFHRNCGGRIYADLRAPNFFMGDRLPERFYDVEGIEIENHE
ncbi:MAG: hypothetical protein U5K69_11865 [Balneolaceae bacterium]|nr:hypothetical protein [Balneolaceae bacterium]